MVPFALKVARRRGLKPAPYLLAVRKASNIGNVARITGNPQNRLIGSFSGTHTARFYLISGRLRWPDSYWIGWCCG
jgi:Na+/H+ antiporter NhaD/arsenite permease-like protein